MAQSINSTHLLVPRPVQRRSGRLSPRPLAAPHTHTPHSHIQDKPGVLLALPHLSLRDINFG